MRSLRISGAALAAACATAGVAAGSAQATTQNVLPTIRHQERTLRSAAASENVKHIRVRTRAEARRDEPKFRDLATALDRAALAVSRSSTSSHTQLEGKRNWVMGIRGAARGYRQFGDTLSDLARGDRTAARREIVTTEKTLASAAVRVAKADKLLKLRSS